jgi:NAD+ synthase (glutamine-hydrolysing)
MKIAMAQNNYIVGDFIGNSEKIILSCQKYKDVDMVVFSELCLSGYYPWDLIYRHSFQKAQQEAFERICQFSKTFQPYIVLGMVRANITGVGKDFYNSLVVLHQGKIVFDYDKKLLPTYNIFDEKRHFEEGAKSGLAHLNIDGQSKKIGFFVCEDGWNDESHDYITNPVKELVDAGASILITINASPSNLNKAKQRDYIFGKIARRYGLPLVYVNQVGANDDIVFDGASFAFNNKGEKAIQMAYFYEDLAVFDTEINQCATLSLPERGQLMFEHARLGLQDYMRKQNLKSVVVGCSGGVDSAVTLALAQLCLGSENVVGITMPSKYSSSGSVSDSEALCKNLGIKLLHYPIVQEVEAFSHDFISHADTALEGLAAENLQARIRGTILMAYSNQNGNLLLTTGNKSEISVGYFTLYGDSNGGLNLIGDLYKTEVYELCYWINKEFGDLIPWSILEKAPSAELAPGQKDTDSLPDYEHLDAILKQELEWDYLDDTEKTEIEKLISEVDSSLYQKVLRLIDRAEFKRKQAAPIVRIHPRAFGQGRKIPIVHAY